MTFLGGMDAYVRAFNPGGTHDLFYTDQTIIDTYKNYLALVINRYVNSPVVLAWELGNDLRCASTLPASSNCRPATITQWTAEICKKVLYCSAISFLTPTALQRATSKRLIRRTSSLLGKFLLRHDIAPTICSQRRWLLLSTMPQNLC